MHSVPVITSVIKLSGTYSQGQRKVVRWLGYPKEEWEIASRPFLKNLEEMNPVFAAHTWRFQSSALSVLGATSTDKASYYRDIVKPNMCERFVKRNNLAHILEETKQKEQQICK